MAVEGKGPFQGECALCKNTRGLRNSHLLPAAIYRRMRSGDDANPNPVMMTKEGSRQTSRQLRARLLCSACEQLFNENGERWVLAHYSRENEFPLHDILRKATPIWPNRKILVFAAKQIPSIEVGQLVYFASSVFWRASVHSWKFLNVPGNIDLGNRYDEEFRQYLLGTADFPNNAAMWVSVCASREPLTFASCPHEKKAERHHQFNLAIPGIVFDLFVGGMIPAERRRMCTLRTQKNFIYFSDTVDERIISDMVRILAWPSATA